MVRYGRMTDGADRGVADLLHAMLQQHAAMLQVHAESVRLQRLLVERLLGGASAESRASDNGAVTARSLSRRLIWLR